MDDRLPPGQPVDNNIEKAAEIPPEHQEQSKHHHICQRDDPLVHGYRIPFDVFPVDQRAGIAGSAAAEGSWIKFSADRQRTLDKLFLLQMRQPKPPEKLWVFRGCFKWKMVSADFFHEHLD